MFGTTKNTIDEKNKSHLKNLMSIAMADGQLAEEENNILLSVAYRLGMSDEDIAMVRSNPESIKFTPPKTYNEKLDQIYDFISLSFADHDVDPNEVAVCKKLALHLELAPRIIDDILNKLFEGKKV